MRRLFIVFALATLGGAIVGCGGGGGGGGGMSTVAASTSTTTPAPVGSTSTGSTSTQTVLAQGTVKFLTYNVAGLPQGISSSNPATNIPQISPLLNSYDLVVVQEDFWYHTVLLHDDLHPFQSQPLLQYTTLVGDGLNTFSRSGFTDFQRQKWTHWYGIFSHDNDGLAAKGFSAARHELAPGVVVDVYDLHADAGGDSGDEDARIFQFQQLSTFMATYSAGHAVVVAGDTNLGDNRPRDMQLLTDFMGTMGLTDSARLLGKPETLDRVMYRSNPDISLEAVGWRYATEFVDAAGVDLSDHEAVHVDLLWKKLH